MGLRSLFPFQGQLFFSPSAGVRLHIHVNNPSPAKRSTPAAPQLSAVTLVSPLLFVNYKSKSTQKVKHFLTVCLSFLWHVFSLKAPAEDTFSAREYDPQKLSRKVNSKKVSVGNYYLFSISDQADFSTGDERVLMSTRPRRFLHGPDRPLVSSDKPTTCHTLQSNELGER